MSKKEEILESALKLFTGEGYENVGIQKIVSTSDVTKPTLYHYFGSKQGLLNSVLDYYFTPFLDTLTERCNYDGDVVFTLESVVKHYFSFVKVTPDIYRFMLSLVFSSEESEARQTALPYIEREFTILESVFLAAEQNHGNMKGRSYNFTKSFLGMIIAYTTSYFIGGNEIDDKKAYEACRQFMYGIFS